MPQNSSGTLRWRTLSASATLGRSAETRTMTVRMVSLALGLRSTLAPSAWLFPARDDMAGFTAGAGGRAKQAPPVGMVSCGENPYPPARKAEGSFVKMVGCREREVFMPQVDPWEKAADCERALRITIDPIHRETLSNIREFWIALAQEAGF